MKENYQIKMEKIINSLSKNKVPSLLLHVCCAPCSSYVLELLSNHFFITIVYYNPNIYPKDEYDKRYKEIDKVLSKTNPKYPISVLEVDYDSKSFVDISKGLEDEKEGGVRCHKCYYLRMKKTALLARELHFDYFTTTLSISPYKSAPTLNRIGEVLQEKYGINYLYADFKKKEGYKRSIELSKKYDLYRQEYCGCMYSMQKEEI